MTTGPDIAVVGELMVECTINVPRLPTANLTLMVEGEHDLKIGGPAVNVARHLTRLGKQPRLVGFHGDEEDGSVQTLVRKIGTDSSSLMSFQGHTDLLIALLRSNDHFSIYSRAEIPERLFAELRLQLASADWIVANGSRHPRLQQVYEEFAIADSSPFIFNPSYTIFEYDPSCLAKVVSNSTLVTLNEEEARFLCATLKTGLDTIARESGAIIVNTLAHRGSIVYSDDEKHSFPALSKRPGNIIGAGDAFLAAFAHEYFSTHSVQTAAVFASRFAAEEICVAGS